MARILSNAKFDDVWKFMSIDEIVSEFPYLKMRKEIIGAWKNALQVWGYPTEIKEELAPTGIRFRVLIYRLMRIFS